MAQFGMTVFLQCDSKPLEYVLDEIRTLADSDIDVPQRLFEAPQNTLATIESGEFDRGVLPCTVRPTPFLLGVLEEMRGAV